MEGMECTGWCVLSDLMKNLRQDTDAGGVVLGRSGPSRASFSVYGRWPHEVSVREGNIKCPGVDKDMPPNGIIFKLLCLPYF